MGYQPYKTPQPNFCGVWTPELPWDWHLCVDATWYLSQNSERRRYSKLLEDGCRGILSPAADGIRCNFRLWKPVKNRMHIVIGCRIVRAHRKMNMLLFVALALHSHSSSNCEHCIIWAEGKSIYSSNNCCTGTTGLQCRLDFMYSQSSMKILVTSAAKELS